MSSTQEVGEIFGAGAGPAHAMLRSPTVLIGLIGLWGCNVYFFRLFGIDYVKVLNHDLRKLRKMAEEEDGADSRRLAKKDVAETDSHNNNASEQQRIMADQQSDDEELTIMDTSPLDEPDEITAGQLMILSVTLLVLLHTTYVIWIDWLNGGTIGAIFAFYGAVGTAILFPIKSSRWLRHASAMVLHRVLELVKPRCQCNDERVPRPIPFIDVFFADILCSLSKVFFDWGMLLHMASFYPKPVPATPWNIIIPSAAAAVPYLIRTRQCLVMWTVTRRKKNPQRFEHLWNALKYATSIFPLILSAYQKTVMKERADDLEGVLIILLVINATYALWWDIVMDWGMMKNPTEAAAYICAPPMPSSSSTSNVGSYSAVPVRDAHFSPPGRNPSGTVTPFSCWYALLRKRLRYGVTISVVILVVDVVLRFSWMLRFYHKLFPGNDSFVLCTQFLEVFRRALWNLLRVEWENLKQAGHHLPSKPSGSPASVVQLTAAPTAKVSSTPTVTPMTEDSGYLVQRTANVTAGYSKQNKQQHNKITMKKNVEA